MSNPKLGPLIELYLATEFIGKAPSTLATVKSALEIFEEFVAGRDIFTADRKVDMAIYREWIAREYQRTQGSTALKTTGIIVGFLNWLVVHGVLASDTHRLVKRPRCSKKPPRPSFTIDEYERLKATALEINPPWHWMIMVGWNIGQSIVDCALLKHSEVDLNGMQITLKRQKMKAKHATAKIHIAPNGEFHMALLERLKNRDNAWPNQPDKGIYYLDPDFAMVALRSLSGGNNNSSLSDSFRKILVKSGVDRRKTFHSLRATMCTGLVNSGVNPVVACQITGHSNLSSLMRYATVSNASISEAMAKFRMHQAMGQAIQKPVDAILPPTN